MIFGPGLVRATPGSNALHLLTRKLLGFLLSIQCNRQFVYTTYGNGLNFYGSGLKLTVCMYANFMLVFCSMCFAQICTSVYGFMPIRVCMLPRY